MKTTCVSGRAETETRKNIQYHPGDWRNLPRRSLRSSFSSSRLLILSSSWFISLIMVSISWSLTRICFLHSLISVIAASKPSVPWNTTKYQGTHQILIPSHHSLSLYEKRNGSKWGLEPQNLNVIKSWKNAHCTFVICKTWTHSLIKTDSTEGVIEFFVFLPSVGFCQLGGTLSLQDLLFCHLKLSAQVVHLALLYAGGQACQWKNWS